MISMGSREGRNGIEQGFSRRDVLMEDVEIEEGEACSDDSKIDPDVALSYIGEKLQNVLGHFQKDFEGLVSADSLGPKNGEYGTFLPAYRRSPLSHCKSPPRVQTRHTPQPPSTLPAEGRNHNTLAASNASHFVKRGSASAQPASLTACNPVTQNVQSVQIPKAQSIQEGIPPKSENRDQRTLKVRIKVGSDNLAVKKNTAIYSGLGLDGSPSPSFDEGLKESQRLSRRQACDSLESPTRILQIMTSFPLLGGCVLSPLTDDLLRISEKLKYLPNIPVRPSSKVSQHRSYLDKDNKALSGESAIPFVDKEGLSLLNKGDHDDSQVGFNFPLKDSDVDVISCEELISNALKLPLLSDSYGKRKEDVYSDGVKSLTEKSNRVVKAEGNVIDTNETTHKSSRLGDGIVSGKETSSSGGRKKTKKGRVRGSATGKLVAEGAKDELKDRKNFDTKFSSYKNEGDKLSMEKGVKKLKDTYSDFFGNLSDHENETMNSPTMLSKERLRTSQVVEKTTSTYENISREKTKFVRDHGDTTSEIKNSGKPRGKVGSGTPIRPSENAFVQENGQLTSDQAVVGADPELWAECDECKNWRLLPPGTKLNELPDNWRCSLQTWLPNLNHCGISEEEGIKIVRTRYNLLPEIPNSLGDPLDKLSSGTTVADILHPIVSSDGRLKKISKSPFRDSLSGPSSSFKMKHQSSKVKTSAKVKDHQLANAQQTKSSDMLLETDKLKTSKQLQPDFHSDGDNCNKSSKIKGRRESKQEVSRSSKRSKTRSLQSGDSNRATSLVQGNEMFDVGSGNGVGADADGKDQMTNLEFTSFGNLKDEIGGKEPKEELNTFPAPKKRKRDGLKDPPNSTPSSGKGMDDNDHVRNKRYRTSKSEAKEANTSKRNGKADRKSRSTSQQITNQNDVLKKDSSIANLAATSSSSKVTVSLKVKYKGQDMKGSPVESVSSSPLRKVIPDKPVPGCKGTVEKDAVPQGKTAKVVRHQNGDGGANGVVADNRGAPTTWPSTRCVNERSEGEGKMETTCSRDINPTSKFNLEKGAVPDNVEVCEEREEDIKNRVQDKFDSNVTKYGQNTVRTQESVAPEKRASKMFDAEKPEPSNSMSTKEKYQCLPPLDGRKNEPSNTTQLNQGNNTSVSCSDVHLKEPQVNKKTNSQNGIHNGLSKHPLSNGHKIKINEAPSPHRRDSLSQAASSAIKEAKSLKHLADRLKNADSMESTGLYFEAALKFLHGASLLEGKTESAKQGDIVQAMQIYSDTAKLCRFCAHEYEKSKDMATAALAYKCMEVAYMKVVYSSHNSASRDRSELQTVLQMVPPGESPSSSASDIDNLNNTAIGDKAAQARSVDSPLPVGNLIIAARNRPNFSRLLGFTQDVNSAMEASRKSHIAFGAASAGMGNINTMDCIASIKRALDFNFHDVEGLLRLVRLAKEEAVK